MKQIINFILLITLFVAGCDKNAEQQEPDYTLKTKWVSPADRGGLATTEYWAIHEPKSIPLPRNVLVYPGICLEFTSDIEGVFCQPVGRFDPMDFIDEAHYYDHARPCAISYIVKTKTPLKSVQIGQSLGTVSLDSQAITYDELSKKSDDLRLPTVPIYLVASSVDKCTHVVRTGLFLPVDTRYAVSKKEAICIRDRWNVSGRDEIELPIIPVLASLEYGDPVQVVGSYSIIKDSVNKALVQ